MGLSVVGLLAIGLLVLGLFFNELGSTNPILLLNKSRGICFALLFNELTRVLQHHCLANQQSFATKVIF
jgi:uncharacterized membrane protein YbaN (DUF454 family)